MRIDLNCDLGESYGRYVLGHDERILEHITSANIACGFHAGDPVVMERTVRLALEKGVSVGAHPGYPDREGFGRRPMGLSPKELRASILYQVGAMKAVTEACGGRLRHVKPHGALYNTAAGDYEMALVIAKAVADLDRNLILVGLAGSALVRAAEDAGLQSAGEAFADRAYDDEGFLVSRRVAGAVLYDKNQVVERVLSMVREGRVDSLNGKSLKIKADTLCLHGDNEQALEFAERLVRELGTHGVEIKALGR